MSAATKTKRAAKTAPKADNSAFMSGIALFGELMETASHLASEQHAELEAKYRGPGVPHTVFAAPFLQRVYDDPTLRDGFAAALTQLLVMGTAPDLNYWTDLTYEDCVGGPGIVYADYDAPAAVVTNSEPLWATPAYEVSLAFGECGALLGLLLRECNERLDGSEKIKSAAMIESAIKTLDAARHDANAFEDDSEAALTLLKAAVAHVEALLYLLESEWQCVDQETADHLYGLCKSVGLLLAQAPGEAADDKVASEAATTARLEVARQAATYIMRLARVYRDDQQFSGFVITEDDLAAIEEAGRVVLNAVQLEDDPATLELELQDAMDRADTILMEQPPKSTGLQPVAEGRALDKSELRKALTA